MTVPKYPLSLEEAKQASDGYVVLTGGYGASCYVVCPARLVKCDERRLFLLAHNIDEVFGSSTEGATVGYVRLSIGEKATWLGPLATDTLWLPRWITNAGLEGRIRQVLAGELDQLNMSQSDLTSIRARNREMKLQGKPMD